MSETVAKKQRSTNMDLLRIVSMLLIILLHSIDHSGVLEQAELSSTAIQLWVRFSYMLTQVCVNCYVLISGYFLVKSKFRLQKLVALWLEVVFYSFAIKLIFMIVGYTPFSIPSLLSCLVPVFTGRYWFITIYFGLYLIFPFLNIAINAMNKKQHTALNIILFVLFSAMVSLHPQFAGMNSGDGWGLAWFVVLYFAAAWFRLYSQPHKKLLPVCLWVGLSALVAIGYVFIGNRIELAKSILGNMYRYDSIIAYICSLCLLVVFINLKIKAAWLNRFITFIAPCTLGVYLIHSHAELSPWLWSVLNLPQYMNTFAFPAIQIGVVILVFLGCALIDIARRSTIGKVENSTFVIIVGSRITNLTKRMIKKVES